MQSPFPGMNPYLEGHLWSDVHHEMASAIRQLIAPQVSPKYITRIEVYTVQDTAAEEEIGIMYPDVGLLLKQRQSNFQQKEHEIGIMTPATTTISTTRSLLEIKIPIIEIRDVQDKELVTAIEILSPVNKRGVGLRQYRAKREQLVNSAVHYLEIDLLRRGKRPLAHPLVPTSHYLISLVRANFDKTELWAINIQDKLPTVPVPLKAPDRDIPLNLEKALSLCFERGLYHLEIDYSSAPPPPVFSADDLKWMKKQMTPE